jgi:hypothetical protein
MQGVMPLEDILTLPSIDSDGVWEPTVYGCTFVNSSVRNAIRYKRLDAPDKRRYYIRLALCMRRDGINAVPIHIGRAADVTRLYCVDLPEEIEPDQLMMGNGHHRVMIAVNLHIAVMRWTDRLFGSGLGLSHRHHVTAAGDWAS